MRFFAPARIGRWGWMALAASCFVIMTTPAYSQCDFSPSGTLGPFPIGPTDIPLTPLSGTPPFTFSYAPGAPVIPGFRISNAPAVPRGYTASQAATLIGIPKNPSLTALTIFTTTLRMVDGTGCAKDREITLQFSPVDVVRGVCGESGYRDVLTGYAVGQVVRIPFYGIGGTPPYTFGIAAGGIPPGVSLNPSSGEFVGTLGAKGTYEFDLGVTDAAGHFTARHFYWTVSPIRIINPVDRILPNAVVGKPYSYQINAVSSSSNPVTFSPGDELPAGLALTAEGLLSGVPTTPTSRPVPVPIIVSDGIDQVPINFSLHIGVEGPQPWGFAGQVWRMEGGLVGSPSTLAITATGGVPPYNFSLEPGSTLPEGSFLASCRYDGSWDPHVLSVHGRIRRPGLYGFTIRIADSVGNQTTIPLEWKVSNIGFANTNLPVEPQTATFGQLVSMETVPYGGEPPYFMSAERLPIGLAVDNMGRISGTPQETCRSCEGGIRIRDSSTPAVAETIPVRITIGSGGVDTLEIYPADFHTVSMGAALQLPLFVDGGTPSPRYTVTVVGGSLPPGLMLLTSGYSDDGGNTHIAAQLTGVPQATGTFQFLLRAEDGAGSLGQRLITIRVSDLRLLTTSLPAAPRGQPYSAQLQAAGGAPPYRFSIAAGRLPGGLSLEPSTGMISGIPTGPGTEVNIVVSDSAGFGVNGTFIITVTTDLAFATTSLPAGRAGQPYSAQLQAVGGAPPYRFSIAGGSLPAGVGLDYSTGVMSGVPTGPGTTVTFAVTDSAGFAVYTTFTITVTTDLAFVTTSLPTARAGEPYSTHLQAAGGTPPYRFSIVFGSLPAGLSLDPATGVISGVPTGPGSGVTFAVTDSAGFTVTSVLVLSVTNNPPSFVTKSLPPGELDKPYYYQIQTTGGVPPLSFSLSWSPYTPPPQGITLDPQTGVLSGTPTISGRFYAQIQVIDSWKQGVSTEFQLEIQGSLALTNYSLPDAFVGVPYSHSLGAAGGTPPYTFVALQSSSGIPPGLVLNSATGVLSGIPTRGGTYSWPQRITDARGSFFDRIIGMYVRTDVRLVNSSLPPASLGAPYSETLVAAGSFPPFSISISGRLPAGLTFESSTCKLSGTPAEAGTFPLWVYVSDASGGTAIRPLNLVVLTDVTLQNPALPPATIGVPYSEALRVSGSYPPFSITVSGNLPSGLSFNSAAGQITGIANVTGSFPLTITVADSKGGSASYTTTLQVNSFAITGPSLLPVATVGRPYSHTFEASPSGAYQWSFRSVNAWPCCLGMNPSTGTLSGFVTREGLYYFIVTARDQTGKEVNRYFTLVATSLFTAETLSGLPAEPIAGAFVGGDFSKVFEISGGVPPYNVTLISGSLPPGLSVVPAGDVLGYGHGSYAITGKPLVAGRYTFRLQFSDSSGLTAARSVTMWVDPQLISTGMAPAVLGAPFSHQLVGAASFAVSDLAGNALPPGLSLSSDGRIGGTPTSTGIYHYYVDFIQPEGVSRRHFNTVVFSTPGASPGNPSEWGVLVNAPTHTIESTGRLVRWDLSAYNGTAPYSWQILDGTVPPGLTLRPNSYSTTNATLDGLLTTKGDYRFRIKVTDAAGKFGIRELRIVVTELREPGPVNLPFTASLSIPAGRVGDPYSFQLICLNGQPPCRFELKSPSFLPQGLTFTQTGLLSGTPAEAGNFFLSVGITDARGETYRIDKPFLVFPSGRSVGINGVFGPDQARVALPSATKDAMYRFALNDLLVQGQGRLPVMWTLDSGELPTGLAISEGTDGSPSMLSGVPTTIGSSYFTLLATDADGRQHLIRAQLYVGNLALAATSLPPAATGVAYSQAIPVSGGTPPYQVTLLPGSLVPPGLTVDPQGNIGGTPAVLTDYPGILYLGITASDRSGMQTQIRLNGASALVPDGQIGVSGGSVADVATGAQASLAAPPGVLPDNTGVTIHVLDPASNPPPSAFGSSASYFVQFTLTPAPSYPLLPPGVSITLPLLTPQPPGTTLVLFARAQDGTLTPVLDASGAQISGIVDATGLCAKFAGVTHFSVFFAGRRIQLTPVISAPQAPQPINTPVSVEANIEKDGFFDKVVWDWGDGTTSTSTSLSGLRTSHAYLKPGVYVVRLELFLKEFLLGSAEFKYLVIYDPAAGFVTGGGWIESPPGAVATAPAVKGKAIIGFEARYKPGETSPSGTVQFQFQAADLRFKGEKYDWLVIDGSRAVLRGSGSLNGTPGYAFLLSAADDVSESQGKVDKVRLRIWRAQSDALVYDTQPGEPDNAMPSLLLQGGTLTIHSPTK